MTKPVKMIGTISYFNSETLKSVEYDFCWTFDTYAEAADFAPRIIDQYAEDCLNDGGMPDTFYYEYEYEMPADMANDLGLEIAYS